MFSESAMVKVRKAIELSYIGTCDVIEYKEILDKDKTKNFKEIKVHKNLNCKLSFSDISPSTDIGTASNISQTVKLFISPEIKIKLNSKIIVNQNNTIEVYTNSGQPLVYETHQEIRLNLFREWA